MKNNMLNQYKLNQTLSAFIWAVFGFFFALYILGVGQTGLFDVDEAIFAEASYEMLETGDYVTPQYNGEPRYHKPPLIYWLQAFSMDMLGKTATAARLPSAILAFLAVFGFYSFISSMTGNRRLAITASVILGANLSFLVIAQAATADMALNFFMIMATMGLLANIYAKRPSVFAPLAVGVVLGLGMLAKGPVSLMVPVFVVGAAVFLKPHVLHNLKCVHPLWVLVAMVITFIPWVQFVVDAKGLDFFKEFIFVHNIGRFTQAMGNTQSSSHFYYLLVLLIGFFPWVIFLPSALWHAGKNFVKNIRSENAEDALPSLGLVWFLSIFIFFSFSATKLPHYILPAYAGAALMLAHRFESLEIKPLSQWHFAWAVPIIALFASIFMLFKHLPAIALGKIEQLPSLLQMLLNVFHVQIKDVEEQTRFVLEQDIFIDSTGFVVSMLTIIGVLTCLWLLVQRHRSGFVILSAVTAGILWFVSHHIVPTVYQFIQQPLANIGTEINNGFNAEEDKLYFVAIHQPSVRFIGGVPFISIETERALERPASEENGTIWMVFKQEKLEDLKQVTPQSRTVSCEGGYCLLKTKMADMRQNVEKR